MKQIIFIFVITSLLVNRATAQTDSVVIVYTHNTNGVLENCDCLERAYGALEKRAAEIDSIRKSENHILLLDTGDILDIQKSRLLHQYVVKAYDYINYDYWTPGDQDFIEGTDFFLKNLSTMSASIISTNIFYKKKLIGQPYSIIRYGNVRIGITGTIRDDLHKYLDPSTDVDFKFQDQFFALEPVIKELTNKTDFIILLSHSGIERDRLIAKRFPSINLIIGGHSQSILTEPEKIGATYISQVGESGYRIGVCKIYFKNSKIKTIESSVILLDRNKPDDPKVVEMIKDYHQKRLIK
jgi:5'-nucleotidase